MKNYVAISPITNKVFKKGKSYKITKLKYITDRMFTLSSWGLKHAKQDVICLYKECFHLQGKDWVIEEDKDGKKIIKNLI